MDQVTETIKVLSILNRSFEACHDRNLEEADLRFYMMAFGLLCTIRLYDLNNDYRQ